MTTEAGTVEGAENAAPEAAVLSQDDGHDWEAEARDLGWIPEAEFKGSKKPERFKTAQEFVEDIPPYVKKLLERQEKKLSERVSRIEKINSKTVDALNKQHQKELAELRAERQKAAKDGDADEVERISEQIEKVKDSAADKEEVTDHNAAFAKRNPWYGDDDELTGMAIRFSEDLVKGYALKNKGQQIPMDEMFDKVERKIKQTAEYKAKFGSATTTANGHAAVDGGSDTPAPKGDPLAKLPKEAREQARDDMKKFPKIYPTAQAWVDAYNS